MARTIEELQTIYLASAQSVDQRIDISQFSDFEAKGFGTGSVGAALSIDNARLLNEAYPQYATSLGINSKLSAQGLPPQYSETPTVLTVDADTLVVGKTYNVPVGVVLTASNGQTYQVIATNYGEEFVTLTSVAPTFYAISTTDGQATNQDIGAIVTLTPPVVSTDLTQTFNNAAVTATQPGADGESLSDATARLINVSQTPLCGTRSTDIKNLVISPTNGITDAVILTNNQIAYSGGLYNTGVFLISGTSITDAILNQGLVTGTTEVVFTRSVSPAIISSTQQFLVAQNIMGFLPVTQTVQTQGLSDTKVGTNPYFKIIVTLQNGYSLSSQITLDGNIFTLEQLIQREVRRAVCQSNYGATLTTVISTGAITASAFLISYIQQQLDATLGTGTTTGTLGAYLINRTVFVIDVTGVTYLQVSSINLALGIPTLPEDNLQWIYDINTTVGDIYDNIQVTV